MAADVFQGGAGRERATQWVRLGIAALLVAVAAAPYPALSPDAEGGYTTELWWLRVLLLVLAVPSARSALRLRGPTAPLTLEVRADAIRWDDGRGHQRTIARAAVLSARAGPQWLRFEPVAGQDRIAEINVMAFDYDVLRTSLDRHGWLGSER